MPSSASRKLLVATTNSKKLIELKILLAGLPCDLIGLSDLACYDDVPENGTTFAENASLKALGFANQSGLLTLAEDSGLCCDALNGAPGIYSARFAGPSKSDLENNKKLLKLLEDVPDEKRGAHFKSAVAIAKPGRVIGIVEGEVHGRVHREISGTNGFGYDPVFFYPPFQATFGMVSSERKNQVSHRSQALRKARDVLQAYLSFGRI
ncbi:MAG: RdgB/HAM1 family non-canonical purine NTP pyrophosphatase [Candidatus Omnitrophica bacterium]|nr:RdgB/HAM1 family non-canonical purine NTP pyrophosphatase [Candidatus Omnitrophota bacterium]